MYKTREADRITDFQRIFFEENPDFDFDKEVEEATKVADAMKAEELGVRVHTQRPYQSENLPHGGSLQKNSGRWRLEWVLDCGRYRRADLPFGADIGDWQPYTMENEYYAHYKNMGFNIFCNVDASQKYWVQIGPDYLRQARRNLDGYRMYYSPDLISDLFDVKLAWDDNRPTPVPPM